MDRHNSSVEYMIEQRATRGLKINKILSVQHNSPRQLVGPIFSGVLKC